MGLSTNLARSGARYVRLLHASCSERRYALRLCTTQACTSHWNERWGGGDYSAHVLSHTDRSTRRERRRTGVFWAQEQAGDVLRYGREGGGARRHNEGRRSVYDEAPEVATRIPPFIPLLVWDIRVHASFRECSVYYAVYMRRIPVRLSEPHPSFSLIRCASPHERCAALVDAHVCSAGGATICAYRCSFEEHTNGQGGVATRINAVRANVRVIKRFD